MADFLLKILVILKPNFIDMLRNVETPRKIEFEPLEDAGKVSGFQSPAADYKEDRLNLLDRIVQDPINTYFMESETDEMNLFMIQKGSILIIDKSVQPRGGNIVVVWHDGKFKARQLLAIGEKKYFTTGRENEKTIEIKEEVLIWGVVTGVYSSLIEFKNHVRAGRL